MKKTIIFPILIIFLSFNVLSTIFIGDSINGYTLDSVLEQDSNLEWVNADWNFIQGCPDAWYKSSGGISMDGSIIYRIDHDTQNYTHATGKKDDATYDDFFNIIYSNCDGYIFGTTTASGSSVIIRKINVTDLKNSVYPVAPPSNYIDFQSKTMTYNSLIDFYGFDVVTNDDYAYISNDTSIVKTPINDITSEIRTVEILDESIYDMLGNDNYIFVLTNETLYKFSYDLNLISYTQNDVDVDFTLTSTKRRIFSFLDYNSYDGYLYLKHNISNFRAIEPSTLNHVFNVSFSQDYGNTAGQYVRTTKIINGHVYFFNHSLIMQKCNLYTGSCTELFDFTDFQNYSNDYESDSNFNHFGNSGAFDIYNGVMFYPLKFKSLFPSMYAFVSGFEIGEGLSDSVTINYMNLSNSTITTQDREIDVIINATHSTNDDFLRYAIDCDTSNIIKYSQSFNTLDYVNETNGFDNPCNFSLDSSVDGLEDEIVLRFSDSNDDVCLDDFNFTFSNSYSGKHLFSFIISHAFSQNYNITLYDGFNDIISEWNVELDYGRNLIITDLNTSNVIYNHYIQRNPALQGQSSLFKVDGEIIELSFYLDFINKSYIIMAGLYEDNNQIYFSDRIEFNNESTNLKKFKFNVENTTSSKSEILKYYITDKDLILYSSDNTETCYYDFQGTYTITGYVSSVFRPNDYNTYITKQVVVRETIPADLGNAFDELLESENGYSATWWKNLMLIAFTLACLYGAGMFRKEMHVKPPLLIYLEFLFYESFMLFIMSFFIGFFPLFYFVLILLIDAGTIVYLIMKVLGES